MAGRRQLRTDTEPASADAKNPQHLLESLIATQLRAGQDAGDVPAGIDPDPEARGLAASAAGLSSTMLVGGRSAADAVALVQYHPDRLFGPQRLPAQ